jgi:hypothetical protein
LLGNEFEIKLDGGSESYRRMTQENLEKTVEVGISECVHLNSSKRDQEIQIGSVCVGSERLRNISELIPGANLSIDYGVRSDGNLISDANCELTGKTCSAVYFFEWRYSIKAYFFSDGRADRCPCYEQAEHVYRVKKC